MSHCISHHVACDCREASLAIAYGNIVQAKKAMDAWEFNTAYRLIGEAKDRMEEMGYGPSPKGSGREDASGGAR
jgi:hypothetical protein